MENNLQNSDIEKLKQYIEIELQQCDTEQYPKTCAMKDTEQGRKALAENILNICIKDGISVSAALAQLESAMD